MRRMVDTRGESRLFLIILAAGVTAASVAPAAPPSYPWPQWGGPSRDFKPNATDLADRWPADGPGRLWKRELGEGFSAVVADGKRLYTMYRKGNDEIVVALAMDSGKTVWEHRYGAKPYAGQTADFGQGPNATPLILGKRLITVGFTGVMQCLRLDSGERLWSHDLVKEYGGTIQYYGYSNSPIAYDGTIIVLVGGEGYGVVALNPTDGKLVWNSKKYDVSYAAPVLINVDGQDQLVFFTTNEVVGIDPKNGSFLWSHLVVNFCKTNCTSAIWGRDNLLWAATKGVGGTRVLRLTQRNGKTDVKEIWFDRKIRVYHWNAQRIGDRIYTSIGGSKKFLSVIDIKTGKVVKKRRGFGSTNSVYADGKLILLDDGGRLALARVSPGDISVVSEVQLFDSVTWTPPTLVGKTLIVRDRRSIMALDLG